jgi:hypothetical protein
MNAIEALHRALDEDPTNSHLRRLLSDAYLDRGDHERSAFYAWAAATETWPEWTTQRGGAPPCMWHVGEKDLFFFTPHSRISRELMDLLVTHDKNDWGESPGREGSAEGTDWAWYWGRRAAEEALCIAWCKLNEGATCQE